MNSRFSCRRSSRATADAWLPAALWLRIEAISASFSEMVRSMSSFIATVQGRLKDVQNTGVRLAGGRREDKIEIASDACLSI